MKNPPLPDGITPVFQKPWKWNKAKIKAAQVLCEDYTIPDYKLAELCHSTNSQVKRWKKTDEFTAYLNELLKAAVDKDSQDGLAWKAIRIKEKEGRFKQLCETKRKRMDTYANDPDAPSFAKDGFHVKKVKGAGAGQSFMLITEWAFDSAFFDAFSSLEKEIARERGEWVEKREEIKGEPPPFIVQVVETAPEPIKQKSDGD